MAQAPTAARLRVWPCQEPTPTSESYWARGRAAQQASGCSHRTTTGTPTGISHFTTNRQAVNLSAQTATPTWEDGAAAFCCQTTRWSSSAQQPITPLMQVSPASVQHPLLWVTERLGTSREV